MTDLISQLAGIEPGSPVDRAFGNRAEARAGAEAGYRLLLEPEEPGAFSLRERRAVAAFVAGLHHHDAMLRHYRGLIEGSDRAAAAAVVIAAGEALAEGELGPWGTPPRGSGRGEAPEGSPFRLGEVHRRTLGPRLAAAIEHAHLLVFHPGDASPGALQALIAAGWTADSIVPLSQLVGFLAFQIRVVAGLIAIAGARAGRQAILSDADVPTSGRTRDPSASVGPDQFATDPPGWRPWMALPTGADLPEREPALPAGSSCDALLARDPGVLGALTRIRTDVFGNGGGGLPRPERGVAAAAASHVNGCIVCATQHARLAAGDAADEAGVTALLDEGPFAAALSERWGAIARTAAALTATPVGFGSEWLTDVGDLGFDAEAQVDLILAAALAQWGDRLMLSLGGVATGP